MMHHHKYSLTEIENMMPWERKVYVELLKQQVDAENKKMEEQNRKAKG